jgi:hypothetical protein
MTILTQKEIASGNWAVYAHVSLETAEITCHSRHQSENGVGIDVWNNRAFIVKLPVATSQADFDAWVESVTPDVTELVAGVSIEWDGSNRVGYLTEADRDQIEQIRHSAENIAALEPYDFSESDSRVSVLKEHGLSATSTPAAIAQAVAAIEAENLSMGFLALSVTECAHEYVDALASAAV